MSVIDFVQSEKHTITVSESGASSAANLEDLHSVHEDFTLWAVDGNPDYAWLKINLYSIHETNQIDIDFNGDPGTIKIQTSVDNFEWTTVSTIVPDLTDPTAFQISLSYSENVSFKFIRLYLENPTDFELTDFEIFGEAELNLERFISWRVNSWYGDEFRENYPLFPDLQREITEMMEGQNDVDDTIWDKTLFTGSSVAISDVSNVVTLTPNNIPTIEGALYIVDFGSGLEDVTNPAKTVVTTAPTVAVSHDFTSTASGIYTPRLLVIIPKNGIFVEFTNKFLRA